MPVEQLAASSFLSLANVILMFVLSGYTFWLDGWCRASIYRVSIYTAVVCLLPTYLVAQSALFLLQLAIVVLLFRTYVRLPWSKSSILAVEKPAKTPGEVDAEVPNPAARFGETRKQYEARLKPLVPLSSFDSDLGG